MAIYYLNVKSIGRTTGGKATSAAAYRAGERIRDERTGRTFDHSKRIDVMHKEVVLPSHLTDFDMTWARDRSVLWNAVELAERRGNARVAREYLVALPHELTAEQRLGLARLFSQELADQQKVAVDLAIHAPRPHNDPRSFHAHLLTTTREVLPTGLGAKSALDQRGTERFARRHKSWSEELLIVRERWATVTNEALLHANVEARIDHRSLAAQGIDREPLPRIPKAARHTEASGEYSEIAAQIRTAYRERVQERQERAAILKPAASNSNDLEAIRSEARENWLRLRRLELGKAGVRSASPCLEQACPDADKGCDPAAVEHDSELAR